MVGTGGGGRGLGSLGMQLARVALQGCCRLLLGARSRDNRGRPRRTLVSGTSKRSMKRGPAVLAGASCLAADWNTSCMSMNSSFVAPHLSSKCVDGRVIGLISC